MRPDIGSNFALVPVLRNLCADDAQVIVKTTVCAAALNADASFDIWGTKACKRPGDWPALSRRNSVVLGNRRRLRLIVGGRDRISIDFVLDWILGDGNRFRFFLLWRFWDRLCLALRIIGQDVVGRDLRMRQWNAAHQACLD